MALLFEVRLRGFRDARGRWAKATPVLIEQAKQATRSVLIVARDTFRRHAPAGYTYEIVGKHSVRQVYSGRLKQLIRIVEPWVAKRKPIWTTLGTVTMPGYYLSTIFGTKPHVIRPPADPVKARARGRVDFGKKVLRFFWPRFEEVMAPYAGMPPEERPRVWWTAHRTDGGAVVWVTHVHHPGTTGRRWDLDAVREIRERAIIPMLMKVGGAFGTFVRTGEKPVPIAIYPKPTLRRPVGRFHYMIMR